MIHQDEPSLESSTPADGWCPKLCLVFVLLLAAGLRLWNLADHGFGNIYYAAAVKSMAGSWHNFLYASFDPSGFLMLDKPPLAFWVQAMCVKLFGFSGLSLHLPQVIEGVVAVLLVYLLVQRVAGQWAGVIAAVVMALMDKSFWLHLDTSKTPDLRQIPAARSKSGQHPNIPSGPAIPPLSYESQ